MKSVILDGYSINPGDLSWEPLKEYTSLSIYDDTEDVKVADVIGDADGIFVSKCIIDEQVMDMCPNLKFIGELATGYDNIDISAAKKRGIAVYNTPAYSTDAVAQHTIALLLELSNHIADNHALTVAGHWMTQPGFSYDWAPVDLLSDKSIGIIGYGNIGRKVAEISKALGMKVNIYSSNPDDTIHSDVITLHCPATSDNYHMIDENFISKMKDDAIIINTARGSLIDETALAKALSNGKLKAAALDVLEIEPPDKDNPLISLPNCYITPHIAWSPKKTRQAVIDIAVENIKNYLQNIDVNRLV